MENEQGAYECTNETPTCSEVSTPQTQDRSPDVPKFADHSVDPKTWGYTYFVHRNMVIKIGHSGAPKERIRSYGPSATVLAVIPNTIISEREAHERFAHLRVTGEWFADTPELREFIEWLKTQVPPVVTIKSRRHIDVSADVGRLTKIRDANKGNFPVWNRCNIGIELLRTWSLETDYQARGRQVASMKRLRKEFHDLGVNV